MIIFPVKPWFVSKDGKTVAKKLGDDLTLECGARGYPLKVEWKFKSETDETVKTCIGKFELDIIRKNFYCLSVSSFSAFNQSVSESYCLFSCLSTILSVTLPDSLVASQPFSSVSQSASQLVSQSVSQSVR